MTKIQFHTRIVFYYDRLLKQNNSNQLLPFVSTSRPRPNNMAIVQVSCATTQ